MILGWNDLPNKMDPRLETSLDGKIFQYWGKQKLQKWAKNNHLFEKWGYILVKRKDGLQYKIAGALLILQIQSYDWVQHGHNLKNFFIDSLQSEMFISHDTRSCPFATTASV